MDTDYAALSFEAMGCRFEILIDHHRAPMSRGDCAAICEELREIVLDWHARLSVFDARSMVSRINHAPADRAIPIDEDLYQLISLCERFRARSGGAFNIAAGSLMEAHGFRASTPSKAGPITPSIPFQIDESNRTITKSDDRVMLDFGAIAKGFVLDLLRMELERYKITDAFIHGGTSSVLGIGGSGRSGVWSAAIHEGLVVELSGYAMGVSEVLGRTVRQGDRSIGHLMDPRTGLPVKNDLSGVVCVHRSAAAADAYSTACCVSADLVGQLCDEPCTLVVFRADSNPIVHDPLGVVRTRSEDQK